MARGGENNTLALHPKKKKSTKQKTKRRSSNILFQPPQRANNDIYSSEPTEAAYKLARKIVRDLQSDKPLSLMLALKKREYIPGKSPALDFIFEDITAKHLQAMHKRLGTSLDRRGRDELEILERDVSQKIAKETISTFREGVSTEEKSEKIHGQLAALDGFLEQRALFNKKGGPMRDALLEKIATTPLEEIDEDLLTSLLASRDEKSKEAIHEIVKRKAVDLIRRNIPYNFHSARNLDYGLLRLSRKGPSLLHLLDDKRKTLCGKRGAKTHRVSYGDWVDGVRSGKYKRCQKCQKNAPDDLLMRVEAERSDLAQDILPREQQTALRDITADKRIAALLRKGLREGKESYVLAEEVDHYLIPRVVPIVSRASDRAVSAEPRGKVSKYGEAHILWSLVSYELEKKIEGAGYSIRGHTSFKFKTEDPDILLSLTGADEREKAMLYHFRGNEAESYAESQKYHEKGEEILERSIRRSLRQLKKETEGKSSLF